MRQATRRAIINVAPRLYWGFRHWRRGDEEFELKLLPLLCSATQTSVDVGANFGMYTVRMASLSRQCIAFEPIPAFARMLARGFGKCLTVHQIALSDRAGTASLRVPDLHTGYATIDAANRLTSRSASSIEELEVRLARLDDFDLEDVGFMKIDVEGHEEAVLRGSAATLARCRPNLIVEVEERHNRGSIGRVVSWMAEQGYAGFGIVDGAIEDLAQYDLAVHQAEIGTERYTRNIIFVPNERQAQIHDTLVGFLKGFESTAT